MKQVKTVFITGASTGIGRCTAEYFAAKGWQVAATMRTPEKYPELAKIPGIKVFKLDVLDQASISAAIQDAIKAFGKIDVLVNNAGYGAVGPFEAASTDQIQRQFETNVFGLMNVCREIIPHFRDNQDGTLINIASMGGRITFPLYSLYHGTKWAVEGFSESLHYELRQFGIRVKIIEPGAIKTDFGERSAEVMSKPGLTVYDKYVTKTMGKMAASYNGAPGPIIIAKAILKAATNKSSSLRTTVGKEAPALLFIRRLIPESWFYGIVRSAVE